MKAAVDGRREPLLRTGGGGDRSICLQSLKAGRALVLLSLEGIHQLFMGGHGLEVQHVTMQNGQPCTMAMLLPLLQLL